MKDFVFYIPTNNEDSASMAIAARNMGFLVLGDEDWETESRIFPYGSIETMKASQEGWGSRGIVDWCDWSRLACTSYYAKWGDLMLTQYYGFYPLAELRSKERNLWLLYSDRDARCYVRPNDNDKIFSGGVIQKGNLGPWLLQGEPSALKDDLLVLIGRPTPLNAEYRVWMANGEVVTASRYMLGDRIDYSRNCPIEVEEVARAAARRWSPHPMFVLDIGMTNSGFAAIIECGSVHTCGLYNADVEKIVSSIAKICS